MYSEAYQARRAQLTGWPKGALIEQCVRYGHHGVSDGRQGLGGWNYEELIAAILRSEFPAEASNG